MVAVTGAGLQIEAVRGLFLEYAQSLGFSDCAPYYDNACVGSRCMLREL